MLPMKTEIKFGTIFRKDYRKADKKIRLEFAQTLEIFLDDPDQPTLRKHFLKEKFIGYQSIDITEDWRAIFKENSTKKKTIITFHRLGTHKELYG
jgi:addiction module RelE/StbE family toxin